MAVYTLPDLPYDYAALEPHISAKIMELHHDKHHATYVAGANTALEKMAEARANGDGAAAATTIQGSGWAILALEPVGGNLVIEQMYDQQNGVPVATTPLLMLDMWEHAFYLDYLNVKADYVKAFWNIVNWQDAQARFDAAKSQTAGLIVR